MKVWCDSCTPPLPPSRARRPHSPRVKLWKTMRSKFGLISERPWRDSGALWVAAYAKSAWSRTNLAGSRRVSSQLCLDGPSGLRSLGSLLRISPAVGESESLTGPILSRNPRNIAQTQTWVLRDPAQAVQAIDAAFAPLSLRLNHFAAENCAHSLLGHAMLLAPNCFMNCRLRALQSHAPGKRW